MQISPSVFQHVPLHCPSSHSLYSNDKFPFLPRTLGPPFFSKQAELLVSVLGFFIDDTDQEP